MSWTDFYGFKSSPYHGATDSDFSMDDFRDARRQGYTGMSILEWMKPGGSYQDGVWTGETIEDRRGGVDVMRDLRNLERTEQGMKTGYEKLQSQLSGLQAPDLSDYAKTSDLSGYARQESLGGYAKTSDLLNYAKDTDLTNLETDVTNLTGAGQALSGRLGIVESTQAKQKTDIGKAMTEALKVRTTSAQPVQNQATPIGIQAAQSPSAQAGMISAGLAGLSRSNKKFKNKTLNI